MYGYIYETTNLVNGKKYIGQRKYGLQEPYLGSGKYLKLAFKKYGKENFSKRIICEGDSKKTLNALERLYISTYDAMNSSEYYNICSGGQGGMPNNKGGTGIVPSEETRIKISDALKGIKRSDETIRRMSIAQQNMPDDIKQRISDTLKGHIVTEETRQKIREKRKLQTMEPRSEETKRKISESHKGKTKTPEHIKKIADARRGKRRTEEIKKRISDTMKEYRRKQREE